MNQTKNHELAILAEKEILQKVTIAMRSSAGPKRWFWELLQNSIDTISEEFNRKINVEVTLKSKGNGAIMHFTHDGTPFKESHDLNRFDDFKNLILPRSGKKTSNQKTVGKFGTGFLSTHNLSLKIDIGGVYEKNNGERFKIATTLDRTYFMDEDDKYDSERIKSITDGLDAFDESLIKKEPFENEKTEFTYYLNDESSIDKVRTGLKDLEQSLPIVMALNSKIGSVTIINKLDSVSYTYQYDELIEFGKIKIQNCKKNNSGGSNICSVAFLKSENLTICWPIEAYSAGDIVFKDAQKSYKSSVKDKMPLVYSTFPMIGSDSLKFPIIVNSPLFKSNERRDGISLTDETYKSEDENEKIELDKVNKDLIKDAVELYNTFIEEVSTKCDKLFNITKVNGKPGADWISKTWFKNDISSRLHEIVSTASIIDISEEKQDRKSILDDENNIQVYFPSILNGDEPKRRNRLNQKLYVFCKQLFENKIPLWNHLHKWHDILWSDEEVVKILEIEDVVKEIDNHYKSIKELASKLNMTSNRTFRWLNQLYAFIDELAQSRLYQDYKIIPNRKGIFKKGNELRSEAVDSKIEAEFICILRSLNPERDLFDKLIDRRIKCKYVFQERSLKENVGREINDILKKVDEKGFPEILKDEEKALRITRRILSFKTPSSKLNSDKAKVFGYSQDIFGIMKQRNVKYLHGFDMAVASELNIRLINKKIESSKEIDGLVYILKKDKASTISWLNEFLNYQVNSPSFDKLKHFANIIPNQYEKFKAHGEKNEVDKMFRPYEIKESTVCDILEPKLIDVLSTLSEITDTKIDWKEILVLEGIELESLEAKTWLQLGKEIDKCVKVISETIITDTQEKKESYSSSIYELLEWREQKPDKAKEFFKTTESLADHLGYQLAFSRENLAVLKDKRTLNIAKKINASTITSDEVEETLEVLEDMKDRLGEGAVKEFIKKAEKYITTQETFKNRLETGKNIEVLLKETLSNEGIDIDVDKSGKGAYDISLTKNSKELKVEVKSYKFNSKYDFRFANSQIIESNTNQNNYLVCTLERKPNDDSCDRQYLKNNLKVQPKLGSITAWIYPTVLTFDEIYTKSKCSEIPLEIPCFDEPRVRVNRNQILNGSGNYEDLIRIIKQKLL